MGGLQLRLTQRSTTALLKHEERLRSMWDDLQEEMLWHQNSRVEWLQCGDKNTKFFHLSTLIRRRRNRVELLRADDGKWVVVQPEPKDLVIHYF